VPSDFLICDYISDIKDILSLSRDKREGSLHKYIYGLRRLNYRHFQKSLSVEQTAGKLLESGWRKRVRNFDPNQWHKTMHMVYRRTSKILPTPPKPELVLFPSFGRFNGRVYRLHKKPVIACAPDFPRCSGNNLKVLLAHEYAHYIRWQKTGIPSDDSAIYRMIFEEGWAVMLSRMILPELSLNEILMANLHGLINMPNPRGGYLTWCRKNFLQIINTSRRVLKSKRHEDLGMLFQCRRFSTDISPIRVGYYLGYRLIEALVNNMSLEELMIQRPTFRKVSKWLDRLEASL